MNIANIAPDSNVSWRQTEPNSWIVFVDGDTRAITRDERGFIAWVGHQNRCWSFHGALNACVEDARWQRYLRDHPAAPAPVMGEEERWLLQFSDADSAADRMARGRAQLEDMG